MRKTSNSQLLQWVQEDPPVPHFQHGQRNLEDPKKRKSIIYTTVVSLKVRSMWWITELTLSPGGPGGPGCPFSPLRPGCPAAPVFPSGPGGPAGPGRPGSPWIENEMYRCDTVTVDQWLHESPRTKLTFRPGGPSRPGGPASPMPFSPWNTQFVINRLFSPQGQMLKPTKWMFTDLISLWPRRSLCPLWAKRSEK